MDIADLKLGHLLIEKASGRLWRVIWLPPQGALVGLLDVNGKMPKGRVPEVVQRHELSRRLESAWNVADECIRTERMALPDEELRPVEIKIRNERLKILAPLLNSAEAYANLFSKETRRKELVKAGALAEPEPVLPSRVLQLIVQYWWFGLDENALLRATEDTPRAALTPARRRRKVGPKNANTLLKGEPGIYSGVNVGPADIKLFRRGLHKYWVNENLSLAGTYSEICERLYRRTVIDDTGARVSHKVDKFLIPTERQFRYHADRIILEDNLVPFKVGELDWSQNQMARHGSATDIIAGPTDIYDMDVGVLKAVLITDGDYPEELGLMSVALCVDRGSRAIVGFYAFMGAERWEHYRLALFYALTSYRDLLTMHGADQCVVDAADQPDGFMVGGWCRSIYVDRGPGRGDAALKAVCSRLKLTRAVAPAERADMKAVVESVVGLFQLQAAKVRGGYSRIKRLRDKKLALKARNFARLTWSQMFRFVTAAIGDHNSYFPVPHLVTKEMREDGDISPVPKALFRWGLRHVRGVGHHLSQAETFLRLMPTKKAAVTQEGVHHKKIRFVSPELAQFYNQSVGKRTRYVDIFWNGYDEQTRYWKMPDGKLGILRPALQDQSKFGYSTAAEIELQQAKDRAAIALLEKDKHKNGLVSRVKEAILVEAAGRKGVRPSKRPLNTPAKNRLQRNQKNGEAMAESAAKILSTLTSDKGVDVGLPSSDLRASTVAASPAAEKPALSSYQQGLQDIAAKIHAERLKRRSDD